MNERITKLFLLACTLCSALVGVADTWTDPKTGISWYYERENGYAVIQAQFDEQANLLPAISADYEITGALSVPAKLGEYSVSRIGEYALADCYELTSITIPEGVRSIDHYAFAYDFELTRINLPASLLYVTADAFEGCSLLTEFRVAEGNKCLKSCSAGLLDYRTSTLVRGIAVGDVVIPEGVKKIGLEAFYFDFELTSVTIPSSVEEIGDLAFDFCENLAVIYCPRKWSYFLTMMYPEIEIESYSLYTIEFNAGAGSGKMESLTCESDVVYNLPACAFTCSGKTFAGWLGSNGRRYDNRVLVFNLAEDGETVTLTAQWK